MAASLSFQHSNWYNGRCKTAFVKVVFLTVHIRLLRFPTHFNKQESTIYVQSRIMTSHHEELTKSIEAAADYPRNIVRHNIYEHSIEAYSRLLDIRENALFAKQAEAALEFWEFDFDGKGV